jgi:signal transduction histidine kinase
VADGSHNRTVVSAPKLRELLTQILFAKDAATLYTVCQAALEMTGARNAMVADFSAELGYMTLRAGMGKDWHPGLLGAQISVSSGKDEGITAYVAATGQTFRSEDVSEERRYKQLIEGTKSELASPIFDRYGRVRGVLNAESDVVARFGDEEQGNLELLAAAAGIALDKEGSRFREEALMQVVTALEEAQSEKDLLKRVAMVTQDVLRVAAYSIFLWDEHSQAFILKDTVGSSTLAKGAKYAPGEGCTGWVCQHGQPIRLSEPTHDKRWRGKYLEFPSEEIEAFLAVPILSGGRCMGAMRALRKKPANEFVDNRFTEDDERLLLAIAEQLGTGLDKLRSVRKLVRSERMAAWGELSAKSSHMIGNRVFALKGDLNELRYLLNAPELARKSIVEVVDSLDAGLARLEEILHEFRDFVTATKLTESEANINEVVRNAATALVPITSPVQLTFELDENIQPFVFDAAKIERAIAEVIENALHFVEDGQIVVRTRMATESDLLDAKWTSRAGQFVRIEIEDRGPGVAEESKETIFQPYNSSRVKGMGLGLSIVRGIIDAHGGRIYETGEAGQGARFVILIPLKSN